MYIYMAGFFVSLGLGIYVQYKIYKPEDEEKTTDKDIETKFNSEV